MKKVASILAVVLFAVAMIAAQANQVEFDFDIETMLACFDCWPADVGVTDAA
jgi:hypothetical protein